MPRSRFSARPLPAAASIIIAGSSMACHTRPVAALPDGTVPLVFANEAMDKADVWVFAKDYPRRRVGSIGGGETATFRVPAAYYTTGYIGVLAERRDRPQAWGELYNVEPEEQLRVRLPKNGTRLALLRPAQQTTE
jgi:hypothetical protein